MITEHFMDLEKQVRSLNYKLEASREWKVCCYSILFELFKRIVDIQQQQPVRELLF